MPSHALTLAAEEDLRGICRYTLETWGPDKADNYLGQIEDCLAGISSGRTQPRSFPHLPDGVCVHRFRHRYTFWMVIERQ